VIQLQTCIVHLPPLKVRKKGFEKIKLTHVDIVSYKLQLDSSLIGTCLEDRLLLQHLKNSEKTKITAKRRKKIGIKKKDVTIKKMPHPVSGVLIPLIGKSFLNNRAALFRLSTSTLHQFTLLMLSMLSAPKHLLASRS
jgi:hypothetical protein